MEKIRIVPEGDLAVLVEFENEISTECNHKVSTLNREIINANIIGVQETVPTFRSLLIYYDACVISYGRLVRTLKKLMKQKDVSGSRQQRIIRLPVCYGGKYGVDMADVCSHTGLTEDEVIKLHTEPDYLIYMLGFLPGFPYLGGLDKRLITPRLENPRTVIPAGAVGIGGEQTGVYPLASPGGWRLIGQTPVCLYDAERETPILYKAGDMIHFYAIGEEEYLGIEQQVREGSFPYESLYV
ncbi:MAG: 5-oxoprolinase subunit PxpB [Lachnospiraceae bacterium]|nr:5-oxoprolinase subunit PxpB [Lachnospiraceae bacterium]